VAAAIVGHATCFGQIAQPAPAEPGSVALERALQDTQQAGRPTVIVATSSSLANAKSFFREMQALLEVRSACQGVHVVELPAEASPDVARRLRISTYPAILAFRQGAVVPELVGRKDGLANASLAVDYVCGLALDSGGDKPGEKLLDTKVTRTGLFHHDVLPSPQGTVSAAPPAAPPAQPQQMTPVLAMPAAMVSAPAAPPVTVSAAAPSIIFQQQAPNIYVAPPAQPANIQILAPPPAAPNVSVLQPAASPSQMFLPAAAPAMMAVPAAAPAMTAPAAAPMAAIPPGPFGRLIGNLGEHLMRFKYPRVPATTTTMLAQPAALAPLAAVPAALTPVAVPAAPAAPYNPPAAPTPTPQNAQPTDHGHGLFHKGGS
jgi:hypothetical protein